jgi:hypothetical protein
MAEAKDAATNGGTTPKAGHKRTRPNREFSLHIWAALATTGFHLRNVTKAGCVLALLLFARAAIARNAQGTALPTTATGAPATATESPAQTAAAPPTSAKTTAVPPKISYVGGQLRIDALNSTLADVLTKVAALTGVKIDVPAGANSERMPVVDLGPGPARQILSSLLSDSNFDYVIQASDTDPEKIQSVLLMPREKRGSGTNGPDAAARLSGSPYARAAVPPEEAQVSNSPVPAGPENAAAGASSLNPQPASSQPEQSMGLPLPQPEQSNLTKPAPLTPPQVMNSQSISQQLQQMYQQRMQMMQQERQTATANPGTK